MKIARVEIADREYVLPDGPYVMSHAVQEAIYTRVVRLVAEDGTWGVGEIARRSYRLPEDAKPAEDRVLPSLIGMDFGDLPALLNTWQAQDEMLEGAVFGVETAMFDRMGRVSGMPLSAVLGGPAKGIAKAYQSISSDAPEVMAKKLSNKLAERPIAVVQAKIGLDTPDADLHRLQTVLDLIGPDTILLADFNGALDVDAALKIVTQMSDPRLVWEDPCLALHDNITVARDTGQPVMFDMCMSSVAAMGQALASGVAHSVVVKPPFIGGLRAACTARDMAVAAGVPVRIDGPWSGPIAAAAMVAVAIGVPDGALLCSTDLTGPLEVPTKLLTWPEPGMVSPPTGPGLGDIPDALLAGLEPVAA